MRKTKLFIVGYIVDVIDKKKKKKDNSIANLYLFDFQFYRIPYPLVTNLTDNYFACSEYEKL